MKELLLRRGMAQPKGATVLCKQTAVCWKCFRYDAILILVSAS
jgi:hypothetical protein